MSSFIVTPYRLRRPSRRGQEVTQPPTQSLSGPERADHEDEQQASKVSIQELIRPVNTRIQNTENKLQTDLISLKDTVMEDITALRKQVETKYDEDMKLRIQTTENKLQTDLISLKDEITDLKNTTVSDMTILRKQIHTISNEDVDKQLHALDTRISHTTNRIETDNATFNRLHSDMLTKLDNHNERINTKLDELQQTIHVLSSRMDTTEASIDRLMGTFSRLSDVPVIQRRVTGTENVNSDVPIQFGELHRVISHES